MITVEAVDGHAVLRCHHASHLRAWQVVADGVTLPLALRRAISHVQAAHGAYEWTPETIGRRP